MRVVAVVQARLGSSRLPAKVLGHLAGRPVLAHVIERVARIDGVDHIVVAIPDGAIDDPLAEYVTRSLGVALFRGSEEDVLGRYVGAAQSASADGVVRVTADCPLLCPAVSSLIVAAYRREPAHVDYVSNTITRTYPRGWDTEVFSVEALLTAHREATQASDREHVTPFIWRQPDRFRLRQVVDSVDRSEHRWTLDTNEDFQLISCIYQELYRTDPGFGYEQILAALDRHPEWVSINSHIAQKNA